MFMKILAWAVVWFADIHPPKACLLKGCSIACPIGREGLLLGSRAKGNEVSSHRYGLEWGLEICLSVSLCLCLSLFTCLFLFVSLCLCFSLCFWDAVRYIRLLVSHPLPWRRYHRLRATVLNEHETSETISPSKSFPHTRTFRYSDRKPAQCGLVSV